MSATVLLNLMCSIGRCLQKVLRKRTPYTTLNSQPLRKNSGWDPILVQMGQRFSYTVTSSPNGYFKLFTFKDWGQNPAI